MEKSNKGLVYFVKENGTGSVKIGITTENSLQSRMASLKTAMPHGMELMGTIKTNNARELERRLHIMHNNARLKGEFFNIDKWTVRFMISRFSNYKIKDEFGTISDIYRNTFNGEKQKPISIKDIADATLHITGLKVSLHIIKKWLSIHNVEPICVKIGWHYEFVYPVVRKFCF